MRMLISIGGTLFFRKGKLDKAIADYDEVIRLKRDFALAYNNRGNAYRAKKSYRKAIRDYNKAISLKIDYAAAYNNRGIACYNKGAYKKAVGDFKKAAIYSSNDREAQGNLILAEKERFEKRITNLNYLRDGLLLYGLPLLIVIIEICNPTLNWEYIITLFVVISFVQYDIHYKTNEYAKNQSVRENRTFTFKRLKKFFIIEMNIEILSLNWH